MLLRIEGPHLINVKWGFSLSVAGEYLRQTVSSTRNYSTGNKRFASLTNSENKLLAIDIYSFLYSPQYY